MTDERQDQLDALAAAATPTLRLTGEQIGSIQPSPDGDWFVDFDEYEEFVPKRLYDDAVRERDELRAALEPFASAFDRDRMPVTARRDYQRASAALHSKDGAE